MTLFTYLDGPLGQLILVADDEVLTGLEFVGGRHPVEPRADWRRAPAAPLFSAVGAQLAEYLAGARQEFDLPLRLDGTSFQRAVWEAIRRIPFGETTSYGALAASVGSPNGVRAVGAATGRNPVSVIVPCHRVVGSDGSLTGYGGGIERKRALLELEARVSGATSPGSAGYTPSLWDERPS